MSLFISKLATPKQVALLKKLEYMGMGKYAANKLTVQQAAEIINELFEEDRLHRDFMQETMATEIDIY